MPGAFDRGPVVDPEKALYLQSGKDVGKVAYYELKTFFGCTHLLAMYLFMHWLNMFCLLW